MAYTLDPANEGKPWPQRRAACVGCERDDVSVFVTQRGGGGYGMCAQCRETTAGRPQ